MVFAKKRFGQHFLINQGVADKIVNSLSFHNNYNTVVEVGPGTGVLTARLMELKRGKLIAVELDKESIIFLKENFDVNKFTLIEGDFLKLDLAEFPSSLGIIGNFPYNISSQIFFKILEHKEKVMEVVGMLQKEVARRIASAEGSKEYGILSVLVQAYYNVELLFEVSPGSFRPPPKVQSSIIRLKRNNTTNLDCDEVLFRRLVKQGFQNRRKTLWNALKPINLPDQFRSSEFMSKRAEQLSVKDFEKLTKQVEEWKKR